MKAKAVPYEPAPKIVMLSGVMVGVVVVSCVNEVIVQGVKLSIRGSEKSKKVINLMNTVFKNTKKNCRATLGTRYNSS